MIGKETREIYLLLRREVGKEKGEEAFEFEKKEKETRSGSNG